MKTRILITGANGYVGSSLIRLFQGIDHFEVTGITRKGSATTEGVDLLDRDRVYDFFRGRFFDVVIHTANVGGSRLKPDPENTVYQNVMMFQNLMEQKTNFTKLISFGSGAERGNPQTPYGLSKKMIAQMVKNEPQCYNLRIYGVFDENEWETRFIKNNINNVLNNKPFELHQDMYFDFFYMKDLATVVKWYIEKPFPVDGPPKLFECCYKDKHALSHILGYINSQVGEDKREGKITLEKNGMNNSYVGDYNLPHIQGLDEPFLNYIGLEKGIEETFRILKQRKELSELI